MKRIIIGLGNPGPIYQMTRHNAGVMAVERLAERFASDYGWRAEKEAMVYRSGELIFAKPKDKFMNQSGEWVKWVMDYAANGTEAKDLWIIHDDLDIRLGDYKIQFGVGPKVHGGINSIEPILRTKDFWRVRLGIEIDNRNRDEQSGERFVLERFSGEEKTALDAVIVNAIGELVQKL